MWGLDHFTDEGLSFSQIISKSFHTSDSLKIAPYVYLSSGCGQFGQIQMIQTDFGSFVVCLQSYIFVSHLLWNWN